MSILELATLLNAEIIEPGNAPETQVSCGYACDLLSWVLAHGRKGMAWTTVQTHVNVIAVAVLMEMACVILSESNQLEPDSLRKAKEEGLAVLMTDKTAYEICGLMMQAGIAPSAD
ncbi:MAG TPA: AraC family transcriptional regulator [Candidatus Limiplasma sp.]|nr:AraC family transcriptional regulator [Candidatus Limiplasma sp.]HPS82194.1 AraC family transcriptional regulator [Candidatus Limiplasma sp.]